MSDDHLTGRLARFAEVARALDPELKPVRVTIRDRVRLHLWLRRHR